MILADVRARLSREDAQLAVRLVSRGRTHDFEMAEATLAEEGIDALLDDPRLLPALLEARQGAHASLALFSYVVVRHALRAQGEESRVLADYASSILLHFSLKNRANRIGDNDDATYETLAGLLADAESGDATRAFLVRAHLGNYALWCSGIFPDHIERRRWHRGGPDLRYFEVMGQRGFRLAAGHRLAGEHGLTSLFDAAADRFPVLRRALNQVSDQRLFPHVHSPERLMRQVADAFGQDAVS